MTRSRWSLLIIVCSTLALAGCNADEREADVDEVGAAHGTPSPAAAPTDTTGTADDHGAHGAVPDTTVKTTTTGH